MTRTRWMIGLATVLSLAVCLPSVAQPYAFYGPANNPAADCEDSGTVYGDMPPYDGKWNVVGGQVNISGATLFSDYFQSGQATNDWRDVNQDGIFGYNAFSLPHSQQLAEDFDQFTPALPANFPAETEWMFQYRAVGSINGFKEFMASQLCGEIPNDVPSEYGQLNRYEWADEGAIVYPGPHANCSGTPFEPCDVCGSFMDVPSTWATQKVGPEGTCSGSGEPCVTTDDCDAGETCVGGAAWYRKPCDGLYGANPGVSDTGYGQLLPALQRDCEEKICVEGECFYGVCDDANSNGCSSAADCLAGAVCVNKATDGDCICESECSMGECMPKMRCSDTGLACTVDTECPAGTCDNVGSSSPCTRISDCHPDEICMSTGVTTQVAFNVNYDDPDENTIYDFTAAWLPIAIIANRGIGIENVRYTELQYLFATGRMPNGENLVGVTRDAGSGTRNGAMNSLGIDPSWGRGENMGDKSSSSDTDKLGPVHQPSNCGGSSRMEGAVQNNRLAIGYTGLAGSSRAARDADQGKYEILNVCKDIDGDGDGEPDCDCTPQDCPGDDTITADGMWDSYPAPNNGYVRPNVNLPGSYENTILDNCDACCGYQIAGSGSFTTLGNPDANRVPGKCIHDGVAITPWQVCESDDDCDAGDTCELDTLFSTNGLPLQNQACADLLNNLEDSIKDFSDATNIGEQYQSPGQWLARSFFLPAASDCNHDFCDPISYNEAGTNQVLQNYIRKNNELGWTGGHTPAFPSSAGPGGILPIRLAVDCADRYSDGQQSGYCNSPGDALPAQYTVHGDFDQSGARDLGDAAPLVQAYYAPRAFYTANSVVPEILGDFNGDGNLTKEDLRFWADGLAMNGTPRKLDRKAGAIAIDTAIQSQGQAFPWADQRSALVVPPACNTCEEPTFEVPAPIADIFPARNVLASANDYELGDFRADVCGEYAKANAGANPTADGRIDAYDIDYCCSMAGIDWSDSAQAPFTDLSCDMDGDLDVDDADVVVIITEILETERGDVNLDGVIDDTDKAIVQANLGQAGGWAEGDMNCDGVVDATDLAFTVTDNQIESAVSRMVQGTAGTFDIPVTDTECRRPADEVFTFVIDFVSDVTLDNPVTATSGTVATAIAGDILTVTVTNPEDRACLTLNLVGNVAGATEDISMVILQGDQNGDNEANAADIVAAKAASKLDPVNSSDFRSDINADGNANAADIVASKSASALGAVTCN